MIRITSKRAGFRRCGMSHPKEPVEYSDDRFSEDEIVALTAEPMLIVEVIETETAPEPEVETEGGPNEEAIIEAETRVEAIEETKEEIEAETEKNIGIDDMTVAQIKGELDILGIEYPDKARKAELFELYEAARNTSQQGEASGDAEDEAE